MAPGGEDQDHDREEGPEAADQREPRDPAPEEAQHAHEEHLAAQAVGGPPQGGHRRYRRGGPREQRDPQRAWGEGQRPAQVCQQHRVAAGPQPEDPEGREQEHQEGHPAPRVALRLHIGHPTLFTRLPRRGVLRSLAWPRSRAERRGPTFGRLDRSIRGARCRGPGTKPVLSKPVTGNPVPVSRPESLIGCFRSGSTRRPTTASATKGR